MKTIKITGVPEHFNYPWKKLIKEQPFLDEGIYLEWIEESRGSGQMNLALREGQTDIAIVLTESFLKEQEAGNPSKMIGFHVTSPLIWGIHIHGDSPIASLKEIKKSNFLVSRMGSGSHLMAYVLAKREGWKEDDLSFKIVDNLPGALKIMSKEHAEMFLWEKFTTKPWVDQKKMKRIGEVPSPWPCFVIAARQEILDSQAEVLLKIRDQVYDYSKELQANPEAIKLISTEYDLDLEDVKLWLAQTKLATEASISTSEFQSIVKHMKELGIIKSELNLLEVNHPNSMIIKN